MCAPLFSFLPVIPPTRGGHPSLFPLPPHNMFFIIFHTFFFLRIFSFLFFLSAFGGKASLFFILFIQSLHYLWFLLTSFLFSLSLRSIFFAFFVSFYTEIILECSLRFFFPVKAYFFFSFMESKILCWREKSWKVLHLEWVCVIILRISMSMYLIVMYFFLWYLMRKKCHWKCYILVGISICLSSSCS